MAPSGKREGEENSVVPTCTVAFRVQIYPLLLDELSDIIVLYVENSFIVFRIPETEPM